MDDGSERNEKQSENKKLVKLQTAKQEIHVTTYTTTKKSERPVGNRRKFSYLSSDSSINPFVNVDSLIFHMKLFL